MKVGIVFSDTNIKIARIIGKRPICLTIPLEKGIVEEGVIKDSAKLRGVLIQIARRFELAKSEVVLGIAEKHIFSKSITVSDGEADLEEKITVELESYVPQGAEAYIDWQLIDKSEGKETIFVASVPKDLVDGYLSVFESLHISIVGIEPLACALVRHIPEKQILPAVSPKIPAQTTPPQSEPVSLNATSTLVVNLEEGEILLTIANEEGGIELTSVLSQEMLGHKDELLLEISDMRAFYDKKGNDKKIGRVLLTGEGVTDALRTQIGTDLSLPVDFLRIQGSSIAPADALSFFPVFALTDLPIAFPKNHKHVNLLSQELLLHHTEAKKAIFRRKLMGTATGVFGACTLFYLLLFGFLFWNTYMLDSEIAKEKELLKSGKSAQLAATASAANKYITIVKKIKAKDDNTIATLSFLADKTPGGIVITRYIIDVPEKKVVLNGQSLEREILLGFKQVLETEGKFQKVTIPLASLEKKGATNFSLSFEGSP